MRISSPLVKPLQLAKVEFLLTSSSKPIVWMIERMAGQKAKPRSSPTLMAHFITHFAVIISMVSIRKILFPIQPFFTNSSTEKFQRKHCRECQQSPSRAQEIEASCDCVSQKGSWDWWYSWDPHCFLKIPPIIQMTSISKL